MATVSGAILLVLALATPAGWGQINNQPIIPGKFYMDSNADCNGPVREIYGQTVSVVGHGAVQEQQGPTSCSLTLRSASNFDHTNLQLSVVAATIRDCDVRFTIFDGDPGQGQLRGYDCNTPNKPNERDYVTTGDTVSFVLSRLHTVNTQYDIEVVVKPLVSGDVPGYENDYGDSWGFFREKLQNDIVVGIVGAIFGLTVILVLLGIILCYRRYRGLNKPWEQHQLSAFRPATSIYETKSKISDSSSDVWASNMSRGRMEPASRWRIEPNRHMSHPSEDEDSVFDDASDVPPKRYLAEQDRRWERERQDRERDRQRARRRELMATQNSSYVQADDDHPQDTFIERVIEPRVRRGRLHKPPSYDEAINESETEKSDLDDDEEDDEVDKKDSSEEESEQASSEEEEDDEEEEEEEEEEIAAAPKPARRPKTQPPQPPTMVPLQPGMQPQPGYPGYPPVGYMGGYPVAHGQFVPMMAAPPTQQFPPAMAGPGHPPPRYPGQRPPQRAVQPTDPPVYSYLVQRGYQPLDAGRNSPVSQANTSRSHESLDDSDRNVLASGVEYMRR